MSKDIPRAKQTVQKCTEYVWSLAWAGVGFIRIIMPVSLTVSLHSSYASPLLVPSCWIPGSIILCGCPCVSPLNTLDHKSPLCFSQQEGCLSSKTSRASAGQVERWGQLNGLSPITCLLLLLRKDFAFLFGPESMDGWGNKFRKLRCHPGLRTLED